MIERRKTTTTTSKLNTTLTKCLLFFLVAVGIAACYGFWLVNDNLNKAYVDLNNIEYLSSSTQRLVRLTMNNQIDQKVIFIIDESTKDSLTTTGSKSLSVFENYSFLLLADEVTNSWDLLSTEVYLLLEIINEGETPNYATLNNLGEKHFKSMTNLSQGISNYTQDLSVQILKYQITIMTCFFAITMVFFNNSMQTHTELKLTKFLQKLPKLMKLQDYTIVLGVKKYSKLVILKANFEEEF